MHIEGHMDIVAIPKLRSLGCMLPDALQLLHTTNIRLFYIGVFLSQENTERREQEERARERKRLRDEQLAQKKQQTCGTSTCYVSEVMPASVATMKLIVPCACYFVW